MLEEAGFTGYAVCVGAAPAGPVGGARGGGGAGGGRGGEARASGCKAPGVGLVLRTEPGEGEGVGAAADVEDDDVSGVEGYEFSRDAASVHVRPDAGSGFGARDEEEEEKEAKARWFHGEVGRVVLAVGKVSQRGGRRQGEG